MKEHYTNDEKLLPSRKEAFLRRLQHYWTLKTFPRLCTHVGDIYEVDFGENVGSEFSGRHLAICLSETGVHQDRVLVIPLTTKFKEYNLEHVIKTKSYNNKIIHAGVMLNEVRLVSKCRLFSKSLILEEHIDDGVWAIGKVSISKALLKIFKEINI